MAEFEDEAREEEEEELAMLREQCREQPKHLPSKLKLGDMLMARGDARAALALYRETLRLKPDYGKAKRKVREAEEALGEVGEAAVEAAAVEERGDGESVAAAAKREGNEHFNAERYDEAWECYCRAIDALKREGKADAKLHTNRAACLLTAERWVPAAFDGQRSIAVDPEWWKGHWYFGQALLGQLKGKRPSPAMQEKAQTALNALERASACVGFPEDKRDRVEQLQARARNIVFYLAQNTCPVQ